MTSDTGPIQPRQLWEAADAITRRHRRRLHRDTNDGTTWTEWVQLPSLWEQLVEAVAGSEQGHAHGVPGSRPPADIAAMSLQIEIADTVRWALRQARIKRCYDTPRELRAIVSHVIRTGDPDAMRWWHDAVTGWAARIKATISNDPDRSWRLHGAACRVCHSTSVPAWNDDGEQVRVPALRVHSTDGWIDEVVCDFCGSKLEGDALVAVVRDAERHPVQHARTA